MDPLKEKAVAAQKTVSDFLNNFCHDKKAFLEAMQGDHRTLQQSFTGLCLAWLQTVASPEYRTDGRNEYSQTVARKLLANVEPHELYTPLI